jgi:hypothetical protein
LTLSGAALAQPMIPAGVILRGGGAAGPGMVNLPYPAVCGGDTWFVFGDGALRQQTGQPIYAEGARLSINGAIFSVPNNQAGLDAKTGELVLEDNALNGFAVTRRILFDKTGAPVRYVDVIRNTMPRDQTVNVGLQTMLNFGISQSQVISDPKHKERSIAWAGMTNAGRAALEIYAGGGKTAPSILNPPGGNVVQCSFNLTIPAGKEAAIVHEHLFVPSVEAAAKYVHDMNAASVMRTVSPELRKSVVNFPPNDDGLPDLEILRGDAFDVIELRGGDQLKGDLRETTYSLTTFYGPVDLPADRVVGLLNVGAVAPRQLLVTSDGEIFGGQLAKPSIDMALSSGQVVSVPVDQITRAGCRKRPNENDDWTFEKSMVFMRGGDRVVVQPPVQKIDAATRCGMLELDPATVAAITFAPEDGGVEDVYLTDGSKLSAALSSPLMEMKLDGDGPAATVRFPVSGMMRLQLTAKTPDADSDGPRMTLTNGDLLSASPQEELKLQTSFDTILIEGEQISRIARSQAASGGDVQITLWDGSTITGQLTEPTVHCRLLCGVEVNVPVPLIDEYDQPHPQPSADMVHHIQSVAADLGADDWRQRDRAEATLAAMGPPVIGVLRELQSKMDAEAQQRIDEIIKKLEADAGKAGMGG